MINYQRGKIYKITGTTNDGKKLIYIGSTTKTLCVRFAGHKRDMEKDKKITSKQVLLCSDCQITLIELFPCNTKDELLIRERYYYDLYDCVNTNKPIYLEGEKIKIQKQYRIENEDKIKEQRKQYLIEHNIKIKEEKQQYIQYYIDKNKNRNKTFQFSSI